MLLIGSVLAITIATQIDRKSNLVNKRQHQKLVPLSQIMLIHSISALSLFALLGYTLENFETNWSPSLIYTILYLTVFLSIGSYWCMFFLLRRISVTKVSALAYLSPPVTMAMAWLAFNETLTLQEWLGLGLAAIAVTIVYRFDVNPRNSRSGKLPASGFKVGQATR
ncbi:hypothetical protein AB833_03465 [Chromatiales bacterium (ex Bugula neritina AB1)]|nr:hypothetical protein AB833_03465 [Chromatiales bacterium (ex Bugula neritina AB1)]